MKLKKHISRFMRRTLMPDETFVREARFHGFYTFLAFASVTLCAGLGGAIQYALYRFLGYWEMAPVYAGTGIGAWICFVMLLKQWTTEIILTDRRLLYKTGFFMVDVAEVDIEQLASDNVQQSLLGRILDYGMLHIRCIEANDIWLPDIAEPYEFRNAMEQQKHAYREHYMNVERVRKRSPHEAAA